VNTKVIVIIVLLALGIGIYFLTQKPTEEKKQESTGSPSSSAPTVSSWYQSYGSKVVNALKGWNNIGFYGANAVWEFWKQIEAQKKWDTYGIPGTVKTYDQALAFFKSEGILTQIR